MSIKEFEADLRKNGFVVHTLNELESSDNEEDAEIVDYMEANDLDILLENEPMARFWYFKSEESMKDYFANGGQVDYDNHASILGEAKSEGISEQEMKKVICSMISEYDASEEEVYDELSSATPDVSRDLVHRLYQMCSGNKEEPQQETSFEDFWNELEDTEED